MLVDRLFLIAGCSVFILLGAVHGYFTLFSQKFEPRDKRLMEEMKSASIVLSRDAFLWKAWIGFNISHSVGAILFGAVFVVLAIENYVYLSGSIALNLVLVTVPCLYFALAVRYWFAKPRNGILLGLGAILVSIAVRFFA